MWKTRQYYRHLSLIYRNSYFLFSIALFFFLSYTSNVHRLPIHSSLDWKFGQHFPFRNFLMIDSICLPYSFIFRQSRALVQRKQTALRSTVISLNWKTKKVFQRFPSSFRERYRYFNIEYLTFFHNQKSLFTRCELCEDGVEKIYRQYKHFSPIEIKSTINQQRNWDLKTILSPNR